MVTEFEEEDTCMIHVRNNLLGMQYILSYTISNLLLGYISITVNIDI